MDIIKEFGVNPILLVAQIVNITIVFFVLKKFLYKPILSMLKSREEEIKKGVEDTEKARKLLEQTAAKEKKVLKEAHDEAKKLIDDARLHAEQIVKGAKEETRRQAEIILAEAQEQITQETKKAQKSLASYVSTLAVLFLDKSLRNLLSEQDRTNLTKQVIKKAKEKTN